MENLKLEMQGPRDEGDEDPNYYFDPVGAETFGWHHPQQPEQQQQQQQQPDESGAKKRGRPAAAASSKGAPPRKKAARTAESWDKIPCLICNKPYQTVAYLQKHMLAKHKICQPVIQVKCNFCGCTFACQKEFELHSEEASRHLANHTGAVAQLRQDQLEFSRILRKIVREESQAKEDRSKKQTAKIIQQYFDCSAAATTPPPPPPSEDGDEAKGKRLLPPLFPHQQIGAASGK
jgi:hypothetical protein